ncbi:MAG: RluA family pseudouridine synthase [Opitutales bacterium]
MPPDPPSRPLLDWLAERYPDSPRKRLKGWFAAGRVRLDGETVRQFHLPAEAPGERLEVVGVEASTGKVESDLRLHQGARLVYLDKAVAVINKRAGILSVPVPGRDDPSALDFLQRHLERTGSSQRALPVHRLDEYTSGLLCFALTPEARAVLVEAVRSHRLERTYLAFVEGAPASPEGTWRHALKLDEEGYHQHLVRPGTPGATEAVTAYELLATYRHGAGEGQPERVVSKLRLRLETGLKHQIRLQAAASGTPLIGDRRYHPAQGGEQRRGKHTRRQALHAVRLAFDHPVTGEWSAWEAPLPGELASFEADLRRQDAPSGGRPPGRRW